MNDLEICNRIAEIEGFETDPGDKYPRYITRKNGEINKYTMYNPLTDDALCFKLMKKHGVHAWLSFHGHWIADCVKTYTYDEEPIENAAVSQHSLNYAVCLAIIEAHNE